MSGVLGCAGSYTVLVHWRGGMKQFGHLNGVAKVVWQRRLGDTADAEVTISKSRASRQCCGLLAAVQPWAHEITIYRDQALIWQGPLVDYVETASTVTLTARDVTGWLDKRVFRGVGDLPPSNPPPEGWRPPWHQRNDVTDVLWYILYNALRPRSDNEPDDLNIRPYVIYGLTGRTYKLDPNSPWRWGELIMSDQFRDIAQMGADWTTVGRRIVIGREAGPEVLPTAVLDHTDFISDLEIGVAGLEENTWTYVVGGPDPKNTGKNVRLSRGRDGAVVTNRLEVKITASDWTDKDNLREISNSYLAAGAPPLNVIRVPDQAQLSPRAGITIGELVCGRRVDIQLGAAGGFCREVRQGFRISQVQGTWQPPQTSGGRLTTGASTVGTTTGMSGGASGGAMGGDGAEQIQIAVIPLRGEDLGEDGEA